MDDPERPDKRHHAYETACGPERSPTVGSLLSIRHAIHRLVAVIGDRMLLIDVTTHHVFMIQEADGSIQLPTVAAVARMIARGEAETVPESGDPASPTARMQEQIRVLDANDAKQGDKAIWLCLRAHWTPALRARFGPPDEPWKIRRWRAALRKALASAA